LVLALVTGMDPQGKPIVRVLSGVEAQALLTRNRVGRIAFSQLDRVDIEPIHYIYDAPWIFGRTSAGAKLLTLSHNAWCAFETDEVHSLWDWESVVVKGPFSPQNSPHATWDYDRAVAGLRRLLPAAFTVDDPTPKRNIVFAVHASEMCTRARSQGVARSRTAFSKVTSSRVSCSCRVPHTAATIRPVPT
jgi:nitroimidazol reductase NimA-like FMN-containing flavoprotein (pyridoxamine 5'-phosphate oxidase superfamily)